MAPRSVVMGMDQVERKVSFVGGGIAIVLALIIPLGIGKKVTVTAKPSATNSCATGYHLVSKLCEHVRSVQLSDWLPQFLICLVVGACLIFFTWRRKRAGVAFSSFLLGLAIGTAGMAFLFLGGWLLIRALRLQKYGDATFSGSSRQAREMSQARRQGRTANPSKTKSARGAKGTSTPSTTPKAPQPSKRYTPKQRSRRR